MMNNIFMDDLSDTNLAKLAKFLAMTNSASRERIIQEIELASMKEADARRNASRGSKLKSPRITVSKRSVITRGSEHSITSKIMNSRDPIDRERLILTRVNQLMGEPKCPIKQAIWGKAQFKSYS